MVAYTPYIEQAREFVIENARRSNARVCEKPYLVRWPAAASSILMAEDIEALVVALAKKMAACTG